MLKTWLLVINSTEVQGLNTWMGVKSTKLKYMDKQKKVVVAFCAREQEVKKSPISGELLICAMVITLASLATHLEVGLL
jgi:hypothetical protein